MKTFETVLVDLTDNQQLELANTIIKAKDDVIEDIVQQHGPDIKDIVYHMVMSVAATKALKAKMKEEKSSEKQLGLEL